MSPPMSDRNKRRRMFSSDVVLTHNNAWPHSANVTKQLLQKFKWEFIDIPPELYFWISSKLTIIFFDSWRHSQAGNALLTMKSFKPLYEPTWRQTFLKGYRKARLSLLQMPQSAWQLGYIENLVGPILWSYKYFGSELCCYLNVSVIYGLSELEKTAVLDAKSDLFAKLVDVLIP